MPRCCFFLSVGTKPGPNFIASRPCSTAQYLTHTSVGGLPSSTAGSEQRGATKADEREGERERERGLDQAVLWDFRGFAIMRQSKSTLDLLFGIILVG